MRGVEGFDAWYAEHQQQLRGDRLCRFFQEFRRVSQHIGENLVNRGTVISGRGRLWFTPSHEVRDVPEDDVETSCRQYFVKLLGMVHDCYVAFGPHVDAHQYYTAEHFAKLGKTIEDAEEEVLGIRGWTEAAGIPLDQRWRLVRESTAGCEIDDLFEEYLGQRVL